MVAINDITGDELKTGAANAEYLKNFDQVVFDKKPVVKYIDFGMPIVIGESALIETLNHPHTSNYTGRPVKTSKVIYHDKRTGAFETLNTRYEVAE